MNLNNDTSETLSPLLLAANVSDSAVMANTLVVVQEEQDDYYLYDGVMKVHFTENICHLYTTTILLGILCSYAIACSVSVVSHIHVGHRLDNIFFFFSILSCVSCYILFCPGDFNTRNLPVLVSR